MKYLRRFINIIKFLFTGDEDLLWNDVFVGYDKIKGECILWN